LLGCASTALADDPEFIYLLSGRATQGGEPVKQSTPIEARVGDTLICATTIADRDGNWTIQVNAGLLRSGICVAVFFIDGRQAGRQRTNCLVELQLEVGSGSTPPVPAAAPDAREDSPSDPPDADPTDDPADTEPEDEPPGADPADPPPVGEEEPSEKDDPDADSQEDDALQDGRTLIRPRTPETGTGGLADRSSLPTELLLLLLLALNRIAKRR
jgi:hypothetical protein